MTQEQFNAMCNECIRGLKRVEDGLRTILLDTKMEPSNTTKKMKTEVTLPRYKTRKYREVIFKNSYYLKLEATGVLGAVFRPDRFYVYERTPFQKVTLFHTKKAAVEYYEQKRIEIMQSL